tara:strand:- start:1541 stop:2152 length:612 start_codon:yes stop_codon:yes gene_type:complete
MYSGAKALLVIGALGMLGSLVLIGSSSDGLSDVEEIDWAEWIVYKGGDGEIYLDETTGYTVYVDKSNDCSVSVSAMFRGEEHYDAYCDSFYDFDNWMQLGDIYPSGSGYYDIEVDADEFVLVDWTTPMNTDMEEVENSAIGLMGCCLSLVILMIGVIVAVSKKESEVVIGQNQVILFPEEMASEEDSQSESPQKTDGNWWEQD